MSQNNALNNLSRRKFIRNSVIAATGVVLLPSAISSCKKKEAGSTDVEVFTGQGFYEGVASFDPSQDKVMLWTRYTPSGQEQGKPLIYLDVARDKEFKNVVVSQSVEVDVNSDYTVHVDVSKLNSNTIYFYRFRNENTKSVSVIGQTKTLPAAGETTEVKMAVISCANFQAGLFNVYGAVADSNADIVVHLGDYIYEYQAGGYGSNSALAALNRAHKPSGETISVADYRERYRQYRSDPQLQKAHQLKPFICVWDDHEIANNAYKDGAVNHQSTEGDYNIRKFSAIQVWHEYLPARVLDNTKIYRNFEIAGLVNLVMLDTRIIGRDKQLNYGDYQSAGGIDRSKFVVDWQDPKRTILGQEQRNWLTYTINSSRSKWQILGNQVLMSKIYVPAELLLFTNQLAAGVSDPAQLASYIKIASELVQIKTRLLNNDPTLTVAEKARVQTVLPYNLDSWDGYPAEREAIFAATSGKKIISIAGDTHNAWYSLLSDSTGKKVGAEFATASVTSPGFEGILGTNAQLTGAFEQANTLLVDDLQYVDASKKGYVFATFTANEAKAEWRFVGSIVNQDTSTVVGKTVVES
jgi:alkaline phosphatase D